MARQIIFGVRPRGDAASGSSGSSGGLEAGTRAFFQQTAAPTGWTKDTTHNDKALRIVSGSVGSGGATAFSSVMGSSKTTGSHTLVTSEIPSHNHAVGTLATASGGAHTHAASTDQDGAATENDEALRGVVDAGTSGSYTVPSGGAHTHTLSGSTAGAGSDGGHTHTLSLDLQYVDTIIAQKD